MRRILVLAAVMSLLAAVPANALVDGEVGARAMFWFPDLSGDVQTDVSGVQGTKFDIKDDLNVGDENFPSGEAFVRFGRLHFRVGYTPVKFDGNKQLTRQIVFNNQTFNQRYNQTVAGVGQTLASANSHVADEQLVQNMLGQQRASVSGVSLDEEMTNLMTYQRAFEASARLITVIDELLQTLVNMKVS